MAAPSVLPEELVSLILNKLNPKEDSKTIHAIRLCNKSFCRLSTPLLYRKVIANMPTPGNFMKSEDAEKDHLLVQELIDHPKRAEFVKKLVILQSYAGIISDEDRATWNDKVRADDEDVEAAVTEGIKDISRHDARIAFFLLTCKNLQIVSTPLPYYIMGTLVMKVFSKATSARVNAESIQPVTWFSPSDFLKSVREVSMGNWSYENCVVDARTLLCLPALQTLRLGNLADTRKFWVRDPPAHDGIIRNTNRLNLVFDMCMISGPGIESILSTAPNAKHLTMRWRPGAWNEKFHNIEITQALDRCGRNLGSVVIDSTPVYEHRYGESAAGTFSSVVDLKVRSLAVPRAFFEHLLQIPAENRAAEASALLPSSLKELFVLGVEDNDMADMIAMVSADAIPRLEKSVCVPWLHYEIEEHFGAVKHRTVDYKRVGGFEIENMN